MGLVGQSCRSSPMANQLVSSHGGTLQRKNRDCLDALMKPSFNQRTSTQITLPARAALHLN
jgi:hypothetical protein